MGPDAMILVFWMLSFKPTFSFSSLTFIKRLLSFSSLSAIRVVSSAFSSVASQVRLFATPWTAAHQASLFITNSWSLLKLTPIELVMPSNHLILCRPLLLLPSIFPSSRVFSNESGVCIRWPICYLRLLIFLLEILIPACASSSPTFRIMYSAYKLNKQGENIQPWHTPFPIWNQCVVPCPVVTVASWPVYTFLRRQVRWSGIPISLRIFHSL